MKRWLDKELPAIWNTRADLIGETAGYQACRRHPRQALIYVGREKLRMRGHFKSPTLNFRFRWWTFGELDGERSSIARPSAIRSSRC